MNKLKKQKITFLSAMLLFATVTYTPNIRYISKTTAKYAHQAAWLVPLASLIVLAPLCYILYRLGTGFKGRSLSNMLQSTFGKTIGKIVTLLILVWLFVLHALYIKYTGEKLVSSVYIGSDIRIFMFLLVATIGVMLRWGLLVFARMNKIIFVFCLLQFLLICGTIISSLTSNNNLTPISSSDISPIFLSIRYPMTIFIYITFFLIFNDQILYDKKSPYVYASTAAFIVIVNALLLVTVTGLFGYELVNKMAYPFLKASEGIRFSNGPAGFESFFMAIWEIMEFVTVSFFTYIIVRLIKDAFNLKRDVPVLTAVLGFGYFFAIYLCNDVFELITFSQKAVMPINLSLGLAMPLVLFITAKIRKLI